MSSQADWSDCYLTNTQKVGRLNSNPKPQRRQVIRVPGRRLRFLGLIHYLGPPEPLLSTLDQDTLLTTIFGSGPPNHGEGETAEKGAAAGR